jgi:3-oxoisoapionate decarboxylase
MRLGLSSYTYVWSVGVPGYPLPAEPLTPLGLITKAAAQGIRVVQIADNLPLVNLTAAELDILSGAAKSLDIEFEVGTTGIDPENLRRYLQIAKQLGSPIVRTLLDRDDHNPSPDEAVYTLRPLMNEFELNGICLAIENHDRFTSATLGDIVRRIDSPAVGICLDTANSLSCLEAPQSVVENLGPWTVNLHIKDFQFVRAPHQKGFVVEGRPAGQGQLDIPAVLAELRRFGRGPNVILELWPPPEATIEQSIAKENAWAEASIKYLRRYLSA